MEALIELLQKNALTPREDIAKMLDMTVEQVAEEVSRLENEGVILGYQTIINREKWGTDIVTAVIEVKITPERMTASRRRIVNQKRSYVSCLTATLPYSMCAARRPGWL